MRSTPRIHGRAVAGAAVLLVTHAVQATALSLDVPGTHPTLQQAVAAAALSPDVDNVITISVSPVTTSSSITLGAAFHAGRRLVIRPAANLPRASVANDNPVVPIFDFMSAGYVTLQDLDILRNVTNGHHIVSMFLSEHIVIERCRIGSHWVAAGTAGWANVFILYPTEITLRNNVMFANATGTFDHGINAGNFNDPANALRLYNNVVSDYGEYGIRIEAVAPNALVLLRNNVAANHVNLVPEPAAYRTEVGLGPQVVSSHNVAFASAALVQSGAGQDIAGTGANFLNFLKGDVAAAFVATDWDMVFDANKDHYRLVDLGPLHDDAGDYGMTVASLAPDIEVVDDIEQDYRPGGVTLHSDRGADQLEPGTGNTSAGPLAPGRLEAAPLSNPARRFALHYAAPSAGRLELEVFDLAGRRLHRAERDIQSESSGRFDWAATGHAGLLFFRLRATAPGGPQEEVAGRVVLLP